MDDVRVDRSVCVQHRPPQVRGFARVAIGLLAIIHGLIHLIGTSAEVGGVATRLLWLLGASVMVGAGVVIVAHVRWWWLLLPAAVLVSQVAVVARWEDAWAGTIPNLVLGAVAVFGVLNRGPAGGRQMYRRLARDVVSNRPNPTGIVTAADLEHLPEPVAAYVRACGAVGRRHVVGFVARIRGRIRSDADEPWMTWIGEQTNVYGSSAARLFFMDASSYGVPIDVLHTYLGEEATMRVRPLSAFSLIDAGGPEMTRAETVTLLNDLCVLTPATLIDAPIEWTAIDEHRAAATYANAGHTVRAELVFDDDHRLIDFVTEDRLRSAGGEFVRQRWSTPVSDYRSFDGRWIATDGRGRWHPEDGTAFDYLEMRIDDVRWLEADSTEPAQLGASNAAMSTSRAE